MINLSPRSLQEQAEALSANTYLANPVTDILAELEMFKPPTQISTVECAEKHRVLPGKEAGVTARYDRMRTPYNVGPQNSLDNPKCQILVMPKPSRSGGTTVAENYIFKISMFGPMTHVSWVLNSDESVTAYAKQVVKPMFDLNDQLQAKVGKARGDDTDTYKLVSGYPVEWLSAKDSTFRNREPGFMVSDETDAWAKKFAATPKVQIDGRQKQLGHRRKAAIMSHPDLGWNSGVAACYEDSTRGIYVMQCPECLSHAAAYATKFWDDVPEFKLHWTRNEMLGNDERIQLAEKSACLVCPHCGSELNDEQRVAMVERALDEHGNSRDGWMHRGQHLDPEAGVTGEPIEHEVHGYWVHGTMLKTQTLAKLARDYEAALIKFDRTKDASLLKEFLSKQLGEIYEGAATMGGLSVRGLKKRVENSGYDMGVAPKGVMFVTAAVDPGKKTFDVMWIGWDLAGRSWVLDRVTYRQRQHADGILRDINTHQSIDDWMMLLEHVADRRFPLEQDQSMALPVAVTCVDAGDGNVTWKAREFARRAIMQGYVYPGGWSKIKLIKGQAGKRPMLPDSPRRVDKDENLKPVTPVTLEYTLGVDPLKEMTLERLATEHGDAGCVRFPCGMDPRYLEEFFGEQLIDGKWVRNGPNETFDLFGYNEAGRRMLDPDRDTIRWNSGIEDMPVWAQPVSLVRGKAQREEKVSTTVFDAFQSLNDSDG